MLDHPNGYRTPARMLHWGIALVVFLMIPAGLIMTREGLPRALQDSLFIFHKNMGVVLFLLVLLRIGYRLRHPAPPLPLTMPGWQGAVASFSHSMLYALLLIMPLSGFTRVRAGGFPIEGLDWLGAGPWIAKSETLAGMAQSLHLGAAIVLIALICLHVGAALYHRLILRDTVWARMWPLRAGRD